MEWVVERKVPAETALLVHDLIIEVLRVVVEIMHMARAGYIEFNLISHLILCLKLILH